MEETGGSRDRVVLLWVFRWFKSGGRDLVWGMNGAGGDGGSEGRSEGRLKKERLERRREVVIKV